MRRLERAPEHTAFEIPSAVGSDAPWQPISTRAFVEQVREWAKGLIAGGVRHGDAVLIAAPTQYLWAVADFASLFAGAVVVPMYETAPDAQIDAILAEMHPVAAFVEDRVLGRRIHSAAARAAHPLQVWTLSDDGSDDGETPPIQGIPHLRRLGVEVSDQRLEARRSRATLDDVATVVYTSGTTGAPKGALITHRNLVGQVLNTAAAYREVVRESGNTILFLPLTHVLGRALQLICVTEGMRVAHLSNPKDVVGALATLKPTFLVVVPRVLEKVRAAAEAAAREKRLGAAWRLATRCAIAWGMHQEAHDRHAGSRPPVALRILHAAFDRLFYGRLRAVMGGRLAYLLSGAATLQPELSLFFRGIGIPVIEGYGLTETTAPLVGGRPGSLRAGTVGRPLPGSTVAISSEGEVLAKGTGVFAGYRNPEHNAAAFLDGYFRTGDLGSLDEEGALTLHGRAKNVIVTSTGRTVSPESWERAVEEHPWIAHAVLIGTDRPYLVGLTIVDREALAATPHALPHTSRSGIGTLDPAVHPALLAEFETAIERADALRSPADRAQRWRAVVLSTEQLDELVTPTMKLKRAMFIDAAAATIDELYASAEAPRRPGTEQDG